MRLFETIIVFLQEGFSLSQEQSEALLAEIARWQEMERLQKSLFFEVHPDCTEACEPFCKHMAAASVEKLDALEKLLKREKP